METFTAKIQKIFEDMKQCVQDLGLKILEERSDNDILSGICIFEYEAYNMGVMFSYDTSHSVAEVMMRYANVPAEKLPALYELVNEINGNLAFNHFFIDPGTRTLILRSGIYVIGYPISLKLILTTFPFPNTSSAERGAYSIGI